MYKRKSRHYYTYFKTKEAKKGREGEREGGREVRLLTQVYKDNRLWCPDQNSDLLLLIQDLSTYILLLHENCKYSSGH